MHTTPSPARSVLRIILEGGVYICIFLLFLQTWFIEGLAAPCRITGGSMALTLLGIHRDVICADCGFAFSCDAAALPPGRAICPNCGCVNNGMDLLPDLDGDRLLIDRSAYHFRRPRRWEIAAFRHPREASKIVIKRVAGLPGETVQIQNGDVYIDGQIQRKTLECQRSMAVMVYDAKYSPAVTNSRPALPTRWQSENEKSLWNWTNGRFTHPITSESFVKSPHPNPLPKGEGSNFNHLLKGEGTIDWLVYHHWRRIPDREGEIQECPITDIMAYNQSLPRREEDVHALNDLMLSFRLMNIVGPGKFFIRATYGQDVFQVEIDRKAGAYRVTRNGREIVSEENRIALENESLNIVVSLIDRQFLLAINDQTVFCLPIDDRVLPIEPTSQPFAIGIEELGVAVEDLRIYRDVYYTHPIGWDSQWASDKPIHLGDNEYFVLGDNSSISEDSRTWPGRPSVVDNLLIGKPLMILFPAKSITIGPWQFQVPDLHRIGYIR
jgi:signal peptidase I